MVDLPDTVDPSQRTTIAVIGLSYSLNIGNESDLHKSSYDTIASPCKTSTTSESLGSNNSLSSVVTVKSEQDGNEKNDGDADVGAGAGAGAGTGGAGYARRASLLWKEKWWSITIQVAIPFIIAGMGTIGAGIVLGKVQQMPVFQNVKNLIILVPPILGLKGNLDMCLASRLSTQANLGHFTLSRDFFKMILGNITIVQVQAIVAALIVSLFAMSLGSIASSSESLTVSKFYNDTLFLMACSVTTSTSSCFFLDFVMIGVIYISSRYKLNPDNVATPLAASIGDIVSLSLLSAIATGLHTLVETHFWVLYVILSFYLVIVLPIGIIIVMRNKYTRDVLKSGWTPVIVALIISGMGGLVLDKAVDEYQGFVVFQPIINGIGGNLVSVQASRTSTMLHQSCLLGVIPPHTKQWVYPWTALFSGVYPARTARILILLSIPGQTLFVFVADYIYKLSSTVSVVFVVTYVSVGLIQVMLLLYICHLLVHTMWRLKIDPDNSSIPYLTALGDLAGSTVLLLAFWFLRQINYEYDSPSGS